VPLRHNTGIRELDGCWEQRPRHLCRGRIRWHSERGDLAQKGDRESRRWAVISPGRRSVFEEGPVVSTGATSCSMSSRPAFPAREARESSSRPASPGRETRESFSRPAFPGREAREVFSRPAFPGREAREVLSRPASPGREGREVLSRPASPGREGREVFSRPASPGREAREIASRPASPGREVSVMSCGVDPRTSRRRARRHCELRAEALLPRHSCTFMPGSESRPDLRGGVTSTPSSSRN
jgi:hypothetical protein